MALADPASIEAKGYVSASAVATAVISSFLFGYSICVLNSCGELISIVFQWCDNDWEADCLVSLISQASVNASLYLGASFGAFLAGRPRFIAIGSRMQIVLSDFLWVVGAIACSVAQQGLHPLLTLVLGRLSSGIALGLCAIAAPVYIAEISPREKRGLYCGMNGVFITVGILASIAFGLPQSSPPSAPGTTMLPLDLWFWRLLLLFPAVPALIQAALFLLPLARSDTPAFLMLKGKQEEARTVLYRIYGREKPGTLDQAMLNADAPKLEVQIREMAEAAEEAREVPRVRVEAALFDPYLRFPLLLGYGLAALQQLCGINALMSYSNSLFSEAGIAPAQLTLASVAMAAANVFASIGSSRVVDGWGRRKLLLLGTVTQAVSMLILTQAISAGGTLTGIVAVATFTVFVMSFSFGLGAVTWLYLSEIYPMEIRSAALSACGVINWLSSFAVVFGTRMLSLGEASMLFGCICALGAVGVYLWIVETKGCSLDDSPLTPRSLRSQSSLLGSPRESPYDKLEDDVDEGAALEPTAAAAAMTLRFG